MIRETKYVQSHRPYILCPGSYELVERDMSFPDGHTQPYWTGRVDAIWFRRRYGRLFAVYGFLSEPMVEDATFEVFVDTFKYGRYGGTAVANWDGEVLWTQYPYNEVERQQYITLLSNAMTNFPNPLPGWDGYYDIREK